MLGQPVYFLTPDVVGVELKGKLQRRRHRHRPRADGHRDAAQGEGRRQVRRVLRRRHGVARRCPIARPSPTWRPSTARRWASSRSTTRRSTISRQPAAPTRRSTRSQSYFKAQGLFGVPRAGDIDYTKTSEARPRHDQAVGRGPEAPAGPHRARQPQGEVHASSSASPSPRTASPAARTSLPAHRDGARGRRLGAISDAHVLPRQRTAARRRRDGRQPPDTRSRQRPRRQRGRHRQRRRADRGDHVVHQHVEPGRAARRGPAREEGGREGPHGQARTSRRRSRPARASSPTT